MGTWSTIKKIGSEIADGTILVHAEKFIPHIICIFTIVFIYVGVLWKLDEAMIELKQSRNDLNDAYIFHNEKICEAASYESMEKTIDLLSKSGSTLTYPKTPAARIE